MIDKEAKIRVLTEILDGKAVEDAAGLEICVKGTVLGFPATFQALRAGFPFGVTYILETEVLNETQRDKDALNLTIMPRYAKGILRFLTRILLFEAQGQKIGDRRFDANYILSFNDHNSAERFIKYPSVMEKIDILAEYTKFSELGVKAKAGLYLSQPTNFNTINLDSVKESFKVIGELGQILFESF